MSRMRRPSPQTMAVLFSLTDEPASWSYGYDLCRLLELKAGTVYPILIRLANRGYVETAWEQDVPPGRPARHLYRLSPAGRQLVSQLRQSETAAGRGRFAAVRPTLGEVAE